MGTILILIAIFIGFGGVAALGFGIVGLNAAKDEAAKSFAMKRVHVGRRRDDPGDLPVLHRDDVLTDGRLRCSIDDEFA